MFAFLTRNKEILTHKKVDKKWGYELWYENDKNANYCGKLLHINKGNSFSVHFHLKKTETFLILSGPVECLLWDTQYNTPNFYTLNTGDTMKILPGQPHSLFAKDNDVDIIEFSTFHEDSDSYRCGVFK